MALRRTLRGHHGRTSQAVHKDLPTSEAIIRKIIIFYMSKRHSNFDRFFREDGFVERAGNTAFCALSFAGLLWLLWYLFFTPWE